MYIYLWLQLAARVLGATVDLDDGWQGRRPSGVGRSCSLPAGVAVLWSAKAMRNPQGLPAKTQKLGLPQASSCWEGCYVSWPQDSGSIPSTALPPGLHPHVGLSPEVALALKVLAKVSATDTWSMAVSCSCLSWAAYHFSVE